MRELSAREARRRRRSRRHSLLLLIAMAALLAYCGEFVAGWEGILWSIIGGTAMLLMIRRMPPIVFLQALNARALARWEAPVLYEILDELCRSAGLEQAPLLCRVATRAPLALTIGRGTEAYCRNRCCRRSSNRSCAAWRTRSSMCAMATSP
jgi:hypothetical protein